MIKFERKGTPKCPLTQPHEIHILRDGDPNRCVTCALYDEITRFNVVAKTTKVVVPNKGLDFGHRVEWMSADMWLHTKVGGTKHSWCYCNDGRWTDLLKEAGVERHPLFRKGN